MIYYRISHKIIGKTANSTKVLLAIIASLLIIGCQGRKTENMQKLEEVEKIITSDPEKSQKILETIEYNQLESGKEKAFYGLLYSMALDKNHLDPTNDTLITYSTNYFREKKDKDNLVKSDYYRGRVLFHRKAYPEALISFFKAKEGGEQIENYFWAGMACRGISDIYQKISSSADELYYAQKEKEYMDIAGIQPYTNYSLLDLARAYNNNNRLGEAIELLDQITDSAKVYDDSYLYYNALSIKGADLNWLGKHEEAYLILEEVCSLQYSVVEDSLYLIMQLQALGKIIEAETLLNKVSETDKPFKSFIRYKIYKDLGDNIAALSELETYHNHQNNNEIYKRGQNISSVLNNYFEVRKLLDENQIKISQYRTTALIFISLTILLIIIFIIKVITNRHRREIENKMIIIEDLHTSLQTNLKNIESYDMIIRTLFGSQFEIIEQIGDIYYKNSNLNSAKNQILKRIDHILEEISIKGEKVLEIEKKINKYYNNILSDFKTEIPNLKDEDYLLFIYTLLKFSPSLISLLLKTEKIENVYNRKRRLKARIMKSNSRRKDEYLEILK